MSVEPNNHGAGRWAVAVTAAALIGAGAFGGLAYAGGGSANVGEPGEDGEDVTCVASQPAADEPACNAVGENGADGGASTRR